MATEIWVNIGSGNGLFPDGTKPLPESILTNEEIAVEICLGNSSHLCLSHNVLNNSATACVENIWQVHIPKTPTVNHFAFRLISLHSCGLLSSIIIIVGGIL